ncbi:hypothetical protein BGZ58_002364 [Dissophora ornata]|nr:hypothetical protein BGZ58_002364 [Dissophora ornata]
MGFCESQRAWLYVGMAIRMAQDLGLNKELSEQEQSRNRLGAELRRRTWWSCYVVDRLVCAGLGRPLTITKQECEIGYPQYDDEDNDRSASTMLAEPPTLIPNFIHLITLSRVQGQILQFIKARAVECDESNDGHSPNPNSSNDLDSGYRVDTSQAAFSTLDKSLAEWRQTLPESLQTPTRKSPHFGLFLHMTYNTSIILLHRPEFFFSATSASLCTQAAATITEITEILMKAKVLSSMFISCLYAIFSAGLIHFINIPSVKRSSCSSSVSPTVPSTHGGSINHALTAKTDLKRCIDALKHVSTHWISAARRAKVLEDLLDLKHVSLKGLEEDSFQTTPLVPSWVVETSGYSKVLNVPRDGHDRLRQQCRSKMMAIQSLLATDDEFQRMQSRRSSSVESFPEDDDEGEDGDEWGDYDMESESSKEQYPTRGAMDVLTEASNTISARTNGEGFHYVEGIDSFYQPSTHPTQANQYQQQQQQRPLDADPMILISTATFGTPDHRSGSNSETVAVKSMSILDPADPADDAQSLITPMTLTTLGFRRDSSQGSSRKGSTPSATTAGPSLSNQQQASMLDPFSMPSSIRFPDQIHGRQNSHGTTSHSSGPQANTVWSTDAHTQRAVAKAEPSPSLSRPFSPGGAVKDVQEEATGRNGTFHRLSLSDASSQMCVGVGCEERECEDPDVAWSDMPPTLGLDEWMTYIGALMMRWLASGESSPRSTLSN